MRCVRQPWAAAVTQHRAFPVCSPAERGSAENPAETRNQGSLHSTKSQPGFIFHTIDWFLALLQSPGKLWARWTGCCKHLITQTACPAQCRESREKKGKKGRWDVMTSTHHTRTAVLIQEQQKLHQRSLGGGTEGQGVLLLGGSMLGCSAHPASHPPADSPSPTPALAKPPQQPT